MSTSLAALLPDQSLPAEMAALNISGLALDSRQVRSGDLFFALPGHHSDGRRFIDSAIRAGAALVIEDGEQAGWREQGSVPVMTLPQLRQQLGPIAARFHNMPAARMKMIGVTGTNGKSSVAWFVRDALSALGHRCALMGTLGVRLGDWQQTATHTTPDPVSLQARLADCLDRGADTVVMEVSSHALVQQRLNGVSFSSAVFTNLSRDHLDYHGDMDSYFDAKARLFRWPGLDLAVINTADDWGRKLLPLATGHCRVVTYGGADADVVCEAMEFNTRGLSLTFSVSGQSLSFDAPVLGPFNVENLLSVAALLHGQGINVDQLQMALAAITPVPGRMQPVPADRGPGVVVDYAHTPDALDKALRACRAHFSGRLWCVVGCGGNRDQGKRPMMAATACQRADQVVFTSDNPRDEDPQAIIAQMMDGVPSGCDVIVEADRASAIRHTIARAGQRDLVLIAGKGHEDYQEVNGQRLPFDDVAEAGAALAQWQPGGAA